MMSSRRSLVVVVALLLPWYAAAAAPPAEGDAAFVADTREYLSRLEKLGFAGVVVIARNGEPLLAEGYGLADRARAIRWTPATVSDIGSLTKQFTAAAILTLVDAGKLRLADPISKHFANVPDDKASITLHQLLTHSSGIVDLAGADDWDPIGREELVTKIMAQPLRFAPGTSYTYSNAGYSLLGAIIEQTSGVSYERYLHEHLFVPMGLYDTGYVLARWGEGRMAQGYRGEVLWGTTLGRPMAADGPYWALRGNGGIHSTAYDMLRWSQALIDGRILSPALRKLLWEPHVREGANAPSFYGYGWAVEQVGDVRVIRHNGANGIFYADLALVPSAGIVAYLETNVVNGNTYIRKLLTQIGMRMMAKQPYPEVTPPTAAAPPR